jgi:predicted GIY-YIG superfamily endonuclease
MKHSPYYWDNNINELFDIAKKYSSRSAFSKNEKGPSAAAKRLGIYEDVCKHMIKGKNHKDERCIYFIEFPNNIGYVGLTNNFKTREKQHRNSKKSCIAIHKNNTGHDFTIKMIDDYMSESEAQIKETYWYDYYNQLGFTLLNVIKTGGLGGSNIIHTFESCRKDALLFKRKKDYRLNKSSSYESARANNWLKDICIHMEKYFNEWSLEKILKISKNYNSVWDFGKKNRAAYEWVRLHGFLDDLIKQIGKTKKSRNFYTKEFCEKEALFCKNRSEFSRKNSMAYVVSKENKWLEIFFPKKQINQYL